MSTRGIGVTAEWDQVWADYDARQPAPPQPAPRALPPRQAIAPAPRATPQRRRFWAALLLLPVLAAGWLGAPYATAWQVVHALDGRDGATMTRHLDMPALQAAVRESLARAPEDATRTPQARAFLGAMAEEIGAAWANPEALAEVARARGVPPGAAVEALRRAVPVGLTRFEMPLRGSLAPITLQLELTSEALAPRWQVTGVRLEEPSGFGGSPALRLSQLR
ncbi:DUF2939 domain-containing protein [Falsiroseomonas sp.]|uniref:DUF2939 domain-containing protein n=1 Tax=Falsiroseomonas sp. TaxID=2870721 RepID=UPI003F7090FD